MAIVMTSIQYTVQVCRDLWDILSVLIFWFACIICKSKMKYYSQFQLVL